MLQRIYIIFRPALFVVLIWTLSLIFITAPAISQVPDLRKTDYQAIFGEDYEFAVNFIECHQWMSDSLEKKGLEPGFILSIVFPELVRYSSIINYIQVKGLEVLYVQYGTDYADFSVGYFQLKPSFAEQIESDLLKYDLLEKFPSLSTLQPDLSNAVETRESRMLRITDEHYQLLYLEAFIRIMDFLYPKLNDKSSAEKVLFYSTAYNTGYFKNEDDIIREIHRERFYRGLFPDSEKYSYSDISLDYYLSIEVR